MLLVLSLAVGQDKPKPAPKDITDTDRLKYVAAQRDVLAIRDAIGKDLLTRYSQAVAAFQQAYQDANAICQQSGKVFDESTLACVPAPKPVEAAKPEAK